MCSMLPNTEPDNFIYDTPKVAIFRALTHYVHSDLSLYTPVGVAVEKLNPIMIDHVTL